MLDGIKKTVSERVSPTAEHLGELRRDFRSRLNQFRKERTADRQQALAEDFDQVIQAWGIGGIEAIPGVVHVLRLRFLIYLVPVLACAVATAWLALALVLLPCLFGIVTTAWRISILKNRRFLPLLRWVFSGFGLFQKRS